MNEAETVIILRGVKALCPAQHIDEHTPRAWQRALAEVPFKDADAALEVLSRQVLDVGENMYLQPGHIIKVVKEFQDDRKARIGTGYQSRCPDGPRWSKVVQGVAKAIRNGEFDGMGDVPQDAIDRIADQVERAHLRELV